MHSSVLQDTANEKGSDHNVKEQDKYIDFNVSELNEEASPDHFNCNRRVKNFIEVSDLLDQSLPNEEFLSHDQMPAQTTKSEATAIKAPDQRLKNIIEIQNSQNIQNSQSAISTPLYTTPKVTEKTTPRITETLTAGSTSTARSEDNLSPSKKVKTPVRGEDKVPWQTEEKGEDIDPKKKGEDTDSKKKGEDIDPKKKGEDIDAKMKGEDIHPKKKGEDIDPKKKGKDIDP